jgi:hypothetical protein
MKAIHATDPTCLASSGLRHHLRDEGHAGRKMTDVSLEHLFIYLSICDLFSDTVSNSAYTVLNGNTVSQKRI